MGVDRSAGPEEGRNGEPLGRLIEASLAGDQDAFRLLFEARSEFVFRVAFQHVGSVEAAQAVVQAVFIRLWRHLHRYDPSRRFDTWLYQVTVNAAIDHHRREGRRRAETQFDEAFHSNVAAPEDDSSTERSLELGEVQRIMNELAAELTDKQRAAFVLREVEGLPTAEVAEVLGTTESTVRNHVFQARKFLREALVSRYPEYARGRGPREESAE